MQLEIDYMKRLTKLKTGKINQGKDHKVVSGVKKGMLLYMF